MVREVRVGESPNAGWLEWVRVGEGRVTCR